MNTYRIGSTILDNFKMIGMITISTGEIYIIPKALLCSFNSEFEEHTTRKVRKYQISQACEMLDIIKMHNCA